MGTKYQIFNWKEYVSLKRFWNMEWKYKTEKAKNEELEEENRTLKDNVEFLHSCLDDRDKSIAIMQDENKKLKSDLEECECSFWFESDEVWFWKREYKRLKKWIKDHCKWYWNLFPEDEMKRQWKKADKRRK